MKFGIGTYTFAWALGVPGYEMKVSSWTASDLLLLAAKYGIGLVQIADNLPLHQLSQSELLNLVTLADSLNIELEIGTRGTDPQHLRLYLDIARQLKAKLLRTIITSTNMASAEDDLREVLADFESSGVTLAIENHGLHTTSQLSRLLLNLNSSYIGSCLDTVNSFSALEPPHEVILGLTPYIVNLHIKDYEIKRPSHQMGFIVQGTPAGSGRLDIPALLQTIEAHNKQPNAILELWTPFTNTIEETIEKEMAWFHMSMDYFKTIHL